MTGIERKALALVNEIERERGENELTPRIMRGLIMDEALCRALEQHEAFKQEVSDAVEGYLNTNDYIPTEPISQFIIPKPKPDPLVETLKNMDAVMERLEAWRAALEARGLEIREKGQ
jgi:chromatin segregation and condensation protein Rec8/ScpA/Scc1 (kleisin family)